MAATRVVGDREEGKKLPELLRQAGEDPMIKEAIETPEIVKCLKDTSFGDPIMLYYNSFFELHNSYLKRGVRYPGEAILIDYFYKLKEDRIIVGSSKKIDYDFRDNARVVLPERDIHEFYPLPDAVFRLGYANRGFEHYGSYDSDVRKRIKEDIAKLPELAVVEFKYTHYKDDDEPLSHIGFFRFYPKDNRVALYRYRDWNDNFIFCMDIPLEYKKIQGVSVWAPELREYPKVDMEWLKQWLKLE